MIPIIQVLQSLGFFSSEDRLFKLVVAIESCAPSAQLVIISLNQIGIDRIASNMAYLYFIQYFLVIFTLTFWATVYISMIYG